MRAAVSESLGRGFGSGRADAIVSKEREATQTTRRNDDLEFMSPRFEKQAESMDGGSNVMLANKSLGPQTSQVTQRSLRKPMAETARSYFNRP
jgi:hypothetical protein